MDCPHHTDAETAERYVAGTLPESERAAFEDHFFVCQACLADVQALEHARIVLGREAPVRDSSRPAAVRWRLPVWAGLAAAAALVVAVVSRQHSALDPSATLSRPAPQAGPGEGRPAPPSTGPTAPAAPETPATPSASPSRPSRELVLAELAVVVPPRYLAIATRGAGGEQDDRFARAMRDYVSGRHERAADGLQQFLADQPASIEARFFLGVSELMQRRSRDARQALEQVVAGGVQPYADEAQFYLAKAALQDGDVDRARRHLATAVEREAGPEGEAARLLNRLRALPPP